MKNPLIIDNFGELLALHRGIIEARFNQDPRDLDVRRGSIVVELANKIVSLLKENDETANWSELLVAD
jgi:hypothetical protein